VPAVAGRGIHAAVSLVNCTQRILPKAFSGCIGVSEEAGSHVAPPWHWLITATTTMLSWRSEDAVIRFILKLVHGRAAYPRAGTCDS